MPVLAQPELPPAAKDTLLFEKLDVDETPFKLALYVCDAVVFCADPPAPQEP